MTARRPFVIARSLALLLYAVLAPFTMNLEGYALSAGLVAAAVAQLIIVRCVRSTRLIAWQTLVDLHLIMIVLAFEPGFVAISGLWIGSSLAWTAIVSPRRVALSIGALAAIEYAVVGALTSMDGWVLNGIAVLLLVVLYVMLGTTLRRDMWEAESALVDALSAAGAVVHHANLEDGTVTRIEGDLHGITGWTTEEWCAASHRDFIHEDDIEQYWIDVDSVDPNTVIDRVARIRHAEGGWVWLRDIARIGVDGDGNRTIRGFSLDVTDLEVATRRLADQAGIDTLTKLPNRWTLTQHLDEVIATKQPFALLMLDLDRFKEVNDTLGHEAGDQLLEVMAARLLAVVEDDSMLARLGGDEFAIVVPGATDEVGLSELLAKLAAEGSRPLDVRDVRIGISLSIGVALRGPGRQDRATLMRHADIAMYEAKRSATTYRFFDDSLEQSSTLQLSLSAALPDAIRTGELMLHFQPKFDMVTRQIVGAEGLARWAHPEFGLLSPAAFLDITLVSESSVDFALSSIRHTANMISVLSDLGHDIPIAANIALGALRTDRFTQRVLDIIDDVGVRRNQLVIELTETDIQGLSVAMIAAIDELAAAGVEISIDDFGTGHSSLERVRTIPVSELKIDRSFVNGMIDSQVERELVRSVINLAQRLDFRLVAEGVETEAEARALVDMGCGIAQGYLFAKPLAATEFVELVELNALQHSVGSESPTEVVTAAS